MCVSSTRFWLCVLVVLGLGAGGGCFGIIGEDVPSGYWPCDTDIRLVPQRYEDCRDLATYISKEFRIFITDSPENQRSIWYPTGCSVVNLHITRWTIQSGKDVPYGTDEYYYYVQWFDPTQHLNSPQPFDFTPFVCGGTKHSTIYPLPYGQPVWTEQYWTYNCQSQLPGFRFLTLQHSSINQHRYGGLWKVASGVTNMSNSLDNIYLNPNCQICEDLRVNLVELVRTLNMDVFIVSTCDTMRSVPLVRKCYKASGHWNSQAAFDSDPDKVIYSGYEVCQPDYEVKCNAEEVYCSPCSLISYAEGTGNRRCTNCPDTCGADEWRQCPVYTSVNRVGTCMPCGYEPDYINTRFNDTECPVDTYKFCGYIYNVICLPCQDCPYGYYRTGCGNASQGTCEPCPACPIGYERTGCGYFSTGYCELIRCAECDTDFVRIGCGVHNNQFHAGRCVSKDSVRMTQAPECPYDELANVNAIDNLIASVVPEFDSILERCSTTCDGTGEDDTQTCIGPYACGVLTCMGGGHNHGTEPRACPIPNDIYFDTTIASYRTVQCQACSECGLDEPAAHDFPQWGAGCAQECTRLLCEESFIFDWTDSECKPCDHIWNSSICSRQFKLENLVRRDVTGNLLTVHLPTCKSKRSNSSSLEYGDCEVCPPQTCDEGQYPSHVCECWSCLRGGAVAEWHLNASREYERLFCQVRDCSENTLSAGQSPEARRTSVRQQGAVCASTCTVVICDEGEFYEPCLLPHDSICTPRYPPASESKLKKTQVPDSVNVLETREFPWHRWASFENVLIRTDLNSATLGYQCVWNAAGIEDNSMHPGGVGSVFLDASETSASIYKERGTQLCRPWPLAHQSSVTYTFVPYPRLALQNTVTFGGSEYGRRVLINTSAHVVSYEFLGTTLTFEDEVPPHAMPTKPDTFIDMGRQFLRLSLQGAPQTDVMIHIPVDRWNLLSAQDIMWWKLSVWMQDLSTTDHDDGVQVSIVQTRAASQYITPVNRSQYNWYSSPDLVEATFKREYSESMLFGEWINRAFDVCEPIQTSSTWGWWQVSLLQDDNVIVTSEVGMGYCAFHACSYTYQSMTAMPYREHKQVDAGSFVVSNNLTYFSQDDVYPSDVHVMAIISMASTPEGHQCLAFAATLTAVYCVAFDPSNMSPDPVTGKGPIDVHRIHSCYTSAAPHTVSECLHVVAIAYDDRNEVLFVANRRGLVMYSVPSTPTLTSHPLCSGTKCVNVKCASSILSLHSNWWTNDKMRRIVALASHGGKIYITVIQDNNHYVTLHTGTVTCMHTTTTVSCQIQRPDIVLSENLHLDDFLFSDAYRMNEPYNYQRLPVCALLVDDQQRIIACHDLRRLILSVVWCDGGFCEAIAKTRIATKESVEQHLIEDTDNEIWFNNPTNLNDLRHSAISIAYLRNNRFVVGLYGTVYELTVSVPALLWNDFTSTSMLKDTHFVPHSNAFVTFKHSDGWPHKKENSRQSCRNGYETQKCLVASSLCRDVNSNGTEMVFVNRSLISMNLTDACYMACLETADCLAIRASDAECAIWRTGTLSNYLPESKFSHADCCKKSIMTSRLSYRFLTTNRIDVKAMMFGTTSLLTTVNDSAVGSHAWSDSVFAAHCLPYYRKNGDLIRLSSPNDFRQETVDGSGRTIVTYTFPDALIIYNQEVRYPFALGMDDHHLEILMTTSRFIRLLVPCHCVIEGFPVAISSALYWIEEQSVLSNEEICRNSEDVVLLIMALTDAMFVRTYVSRSDIMTFMSTPVGTQYALKFFLHNTLNNFLIHDIDMTIDSIQTFHTLVRETIDNIQEWLVGNNEHQRLLHRQIPSLAFTQLETPITRKAQTITLQIHRPNINLNVVKLVALDEIQIVPMFTSPVGWRLPVGSKYLRAHLMTIPTTSNLNNLGIPVIQDQLQKFTIMRIAAFFHDTPVSCSYRIGLMMLDDASVPRNTSLVYPMVMPSGTFNTPGVHAPCGCTISTIQASTIGRMSGDCYLEVPFDLLNADRQVMVYADLGVSSDALTCKMPVTLEGSVIPRSTLYSCGEEEYWDENIQQCLPCFDDMTCPVGHVPSNCHLLMTQYHRSASCIPCELILPNNSHWTRLCEFQCDQGYFYDQINHDCKRCKRDKIELTCALDELYVACTQLNDAFCERCVVVDENAEFIQGQDNTPCQTQCVEGYFFDRSNRCTPCSTLEELVTTINTSRTSANEFFRFFNCTRLSDSFAQPCRNSLSYGEYVAHGPQFGDDCVLSCFSDWYESDPVDDLYVPEPPLLDAQGNSISFEWKRSTCMSCSAPTNVPRENYEFTPPCQLHCLNNWKLLHDTCIDCSASTCQYGQYVSYPSCNVCLDCSGLPDLAHWVGVGSTDSPDSCPWQCNDGFFNEYSLGVCREHSQVNCAADQFEIMGNHLEDYRCGDCSTCVNMQMTAPCNATHDSVCEACPHILEVGEVFEGIDCTVACDIGFFRNSATLKCEACDTPCDAGQILSPTSHNCSDCHPCPLPPVHVGWEWLQGCNWSCQVGYEYTSQGDDNFDCVPLLTNVPETIDKTYNVRCPMGSKLDDNFQCVECSSFVNTPEQLDLGKKWTWNAIGSPCTWTCMPPYVEYKPIDVSSVSCVEWTFYKRVVAMEKGLSLNLLTKEQSTDKKVFQTVETPETDTTWSVFAVVGGILLLAVAILNFK